MERVQLAPIALAVQQQGTVPWVRFVSKRVGLLDHAKGVRAGEHQRQHVLTFDVSSLECSVGLAVDFVAPGDATPAPGALGTEWFDHGVCCLRISAIEMPAQLYATLGWFHES